jgi:hypothetical protein
MWGQRVDLSYGARGGRPGSRRWEGKNTRLAAGVLAKHKVGEEWATLCRRALKISGLEDYICLDRDSGRDKYTSGCRSLGRSVKYVKSGQRFVEEL